MTKRIVLSTSSSCIDSITNQNIRLIPMHVVINNVDFVDGKNINSAVLNDIMMRTPNALASTMPATEAEVTAIFKELYEEGYQDVFVCSISSKFSNSYQILQRAKKAFEDQMNIYIYDSKSLNFSEAALAYEAHVMLQAGNSFPEIVYRLDRLQSKTPMLFTLNKLDYIIRNKKLSAPAGFMANLFNIKPIMELSRQGEIVAKDKIRGTSKTLNRIVTDIQKMAEYQDAFLYVVDGRDKEFTDYFVHILEKDFGITGLPRMPVSTISLANHGPKGVGLGAFIGDLPKITKLVQ